MIPGCPGAKLFKQPQPEILNCPFCKGEVEIWTDEAKAVCPGCGNCITRRQAQSCLEWCKFARECVGEEFYNKYLSNKSIEENNMAKEIV